MGATDSTTEMYASLRSHLLSYTDGGAAPNTIQAATAGRVYNEAPPDPAAGATAEQAVPYVLLTIDGVPADENMDLTRENYSIEVQVVHKPRTNIAAARRIADLARKALMTYRVPALEPGFIRIKVPPRAITLPRPPSGSGGDRELVQILITADGWGYAQDVASALTA